jgi:glycosyltransferase involved in cell wall biosynthesis
VTKDVHSEVSARSGRIPVSVIVFTLNEEIHLTSCLDSVKNCDDVIVVDSGSSDHTKDLAATHGARFFSHPFTGFGDQRNWALENTAPKHAWALILDADERPMPELLEELRSIASSAATSIAAYRVKRRFHFWGRWLRYSSLYPSWVVRLVRVGSVRYINRGHAETQVIDGDTADLRWDLIDENLKGIDEWFERQNRYSTKDALHELSLIEGVPFLRGLFSADPLIRRATLKNLSNRVPARPLVYFIYAYVFRRGFLDGRDGYIFCMMRATYQAMVASKKHDLRRKGR